MVANEIPKCVSPLGHLFYRSQSTHALGVQNGHHEDWICEKCGKAECRNYFLEQGDAGYLAKYDVHAADRSQYATTT